MLDTILKHAKHFTDVQDTEGSDAKKIIHVFDDGSLFITDGIVGLFAMNVHDLPTGALTPQGNRSKLKPLTPQKVLSLINGADTVLDSAVIKANIDVEALMAFTQAVVNASKHDENSEDKEDPLLNINLKVGKGLVYEQHGVEVSSIYTDDEISPPDEVIGATVNAKNLLKVLKVLNELGHDDVQLLITGRFRPVEIRTYDCAIRTVVLPVRTY